MEQFESRVSGIPCLIEINYYSKVPAWNGSISSCPSDLDYYGYDEIEFSVLDRKGYRADWLEKKLTDKDIDRIRMEVRDHESNC